MEDIRILTAKTALNKLFKQRHFSICPITELADLFCVRPDPEAMAILKPLHCVDYVDMPKDLYNALPSIVQQALSGTPIYQFDIRKGPDPDGIKVLSVINEKDGKPSFFGRFLGRRSN